MRALRMAALSVLVTSMLVLTSPAASAVVRDDGDDPGSPMSTLGWIGVFVLLPIALFAVITLLVYAPSLARSGRYRGAGGGLPEPVWFDGPTRSTSADNARTAGGPTLERVGALPAGPDPTPSSGPTGRPRPGRPASGGAGERTDAVGATALDALDQEPAPGEGSPSGRAGRVAGGGASAHW